MNMDTDCEANELGPSGATMDTADPELERELSGTAVRPAPPVYHFAPPLSPCTLPTSSHFLAIISRPRSRVSQLIHVRVSAICPVRRAWCYKTSRPRAQRRNSQKQAALDQVCRSAHKYQGRPSHENLSEESRVATDSLAAPRYLPQSRDQ